MLFLPRGGPAVGFRQVSGGADRAIGNGHRGTRRQGQESRPGARGLSARPAGPNGFSVGTENPLRVYFPAAAGGPFDRPAARTPFHVSENPPRKGRRNRSRGLARPGSPGAQGLSVAIDRGDCTRILTTCTDGKETAARLLPLVYDELRALAARYMRGESPGALLQPTALVHEAYLRLVDPPQVDWKGKTHFFAVAAIQMRRILVDQARAEATKKRGGDLRRVTLSERFAAATDGTVEMLALDEALTRLAQRNGRQGRVAELRLFSGMLVRETAFLLGVSERTVKDDWRVARAWLMKELSPGPAAS